VFSILVPGCFREETCCNYVSWTCWELWHQVSLCGENACFFYPYVIYTRGAELLTLLVWENRIAFDDLHNTRIYICGTFFTLLVNSNFIGCGITSKLWNIKALAETHPERSECSCKVTILFQGMFFCYMLPTSGCHSLPHFMWALSGSGVGMISFSMWWLHLRLWRGKPHIYKEIVSLCLCTNPKPLKMAFMNTLNYVFMNMLSLSKWKYMLACFCTPLITTILCPLSVIACDGKAYV